MIIQEPIQFGALNQANAECVQLEGTSRLKESYFFFECTYSPPIEVCVSELTDSELLSAADGAGTFDFLDSPEEDIYNDVLKKSE